MSITNHALIKNKTHVVVHLSRVCFLLTTPSWDIDLFLVGHVDCELCLYLCILCFPLHIEGCSVQIKAHRSVWALTLSRALSADSPVGDVRPALGEINTALMSPFLEESRNNRRQNEGGRDEERGPPPVPPVPYGFLWSHKQKEERAQSH